MVAVIAATLACGSPQPSPPNILFITIDTLRADRLSSYGYERPTSPKLDALAARGVRFDKAWVQWPKTTPSIASMMTATYPKDNGVVRVVGQHLPGEMRTLAELLHDRGYRTGAVVANGAIGSEFRFDQGFERFEETWKNEPVPDDGSDQNRAEVVNRLGRSIVADWKGDDPYFLWLHYLDPHWPYWPPVEQDRFFDRQVDAATFERLRQRAEETPEEKQQVRDDVDLYRALYDAEIRYLDGELAVMLDWLDERDRLDNTIIVVTADHGESLGENRYYYDHGKLGFENTLRVPLIVVWPDHLPAKVDDLPVSLIDLVPTLLELTGTDLPEGAYMQGRSLRRRLQTPAPPSVESPVYSFAEAGYALEGKWQRIIRDQRFKLYYVRSGAVQRFFAGRGIEFALYDLEADPGETTDVYAEFPQDAKRLRAELAEWVHAEPFDAHVDQGDGVAVEGMSEETRKQLEALGYL